MTKEFRCYGPPGTGKTRWLSDQVRRALGKYAPEEVVACSFTKAAAVELAGRETGLPRENIGTIHSICFHHLGKPKIIEVDKELLGEWNELYPSYRVSGEIDLDETPTQEADDLQKWNRERAKLTGRRWPEPFATLWEDFKKENDAVDFTDLLAEAPRSLGARVLMVDEAQDLTPQQWAIVRGWGAEAEVFVVSGDDDQLIYDFLGADVRSFLSPLPDDRKRFLRESHRLPRAVREYAEEWIHKLGDGREEKEYAARDFEGEVAHSPHRATHPEALAEEIAEKAKSRKVMLLASCRYMLTPVLRELRNAGIPYHNPYCGKRGDWNPLRATAKRILAFLECGRAMRDFSKQLPPAEEWHRWVETVSADHMTKRGVKSAVAAHEGDVFDAHLADWFSPPLLEALNRGDAKWLREAMTGRWEKSAEYPLRIVEESGEDGLRATPRVVVGTIHSVKGGEADCVYLFPDISWQAYCELQRNPAEARGAMIRQFYVGMTRARESLHLCRPSGKWFCSW